MVLGERFELGGEFMKYVVDGVIVGVDDSEREIRSKIAKRLSIAPESFRFEIVKRNLEIVEGQPVFYIRSIIDTNSFIRDTSIGFFGPTESLIIQPKRLKRRPIVVGAGLAGLFAAYVLAKAKLRPIVIEQGLESHARDEAISRFESGDPNLSSSYGVGLGGFSGWCGGASYSDRLDCYGQFALDAFLEFGAPKSMAIDGVSYLSAGEMRKIVNKLSTEIEDLGGEIRLGVKMTGLIRSFNKVKGVQTISSEGKKESIKSGRVVLATGPLESAMLPILTKARIKTEAKSFYMGLLAEIGAKDVDLSVYKEDAETSSLPPFHFSKDLRTSSGRKAKIGYLYPNGRVFNNSPFASGISLASAFPNSNTRNYVASVLVKIDPKDFEHFGDHGANPFLKSFYGSLYRPSSPSYAPCETLKDFLEESEPMKLGKVKTSYYPGVYLHDLVNASPSFLEKDLSEAMAYFAKNFPGIKSGDVIVHGFTSGRTSPFRVVADEDCNTSLKGLMSALPDSHKEESILDEARRGIVCAFSLLNQD